MVPDKTALVDGERRMTYKELDDMTDTLAAGLSELGFKKGDRVAIYMKSSLEFVVAFYALQKLGIIVAWVNAQYRKADARFRRPCVRSQTGSCETCCRRWVRRP